MDALWDALTLVGSLVVLLTALYVLGAAIARGQDVAAGLKKMWSVIWKNMP